MVTEREQLPLNSSIFGIGFFAVFRLQGRQPTSGSVKRRLYHLGQ